MERDLTEKQNNKLSTLAGQLRNGLIEAMPKEDGMRGLLEVLLQSQHGVRFEIHPRDHNPPHFHVRAGNYYASINIRTGELTKGNLPNWANKELKNFFSQNRDNLTDIWNTTRPGICTVGESCIFG